MQMIVWFAVFFSVMLFGLSPASAFIGFGEDRGTCTVSEERDRFEIESYLQSDDVTLSTVRIKPQRSIMAPEAEARFNAPINPRLVLNFESNRIVGGNVVTTVSSSTLSSPSLGYALSNEDGSSAKSYAFINDWGHPIGGSSGDSVFPLPPSYQSEEERLFRLDQITSTIKDGQGVFISFLIDNLNIAAAAFLFASEDLQAAMQIAQAHSALLAHHSRLDDCRRPLTDVEYEQQRQVDQAWDQQCEMLLTRINAERVDAGTAQRDGSGFLGREFCGAARFKFNTNQRRADWLESQNLLQRSSVSEPPVDSAAFQAVVDSKSLRRRYPSAVFATCVDGVPSFEAWFVPFPSQAFGFYSHHGLTDEAFVTTANDYSARGFRLSWRNRFYCGKEYTQAVWVKE